MSREMERMPRQPLLAEGCVCPTFESRAIHRQLARKCSTVPHLVNCWRPTLGELKAWGWA